MVCGALTETLTSFALAGCTATPVANTRTNVSESAIGLGRRNVVSGQLVDATAPAPSSATLPHAP
jgi:hypothetical protein